MAVIETWFKQDLNTAVKPRPFPGEVFNNDSLGNLIGVEVTKDGQAVSLNGSVNGYCILADGETIPVAGTRSGNKASIILPQTAYSVRGIIKITLKLTDGQATTTLLQVVGAVDQSITGNMVNPGSVVQDWSQQIASAIQELHDLENNYVRVDTASQGLTETKKNNGRTNIDAVSVADFNNLKSASVQKTGRNEVTRANCDFYDAQGSNLVKMQYKVLTEGEYYSPSMSGYVERQGYSCIKDIHVAPGTTYYFIGVNAIEFDENDNRLAIHNGAMSYANSFTTTENTDYVVLNYDGVPTGNIGGDNYILTTISGTQIPYGVTDDDLVLQDENFRNYRMPYSDVIDFVDKTDGGLRSRFSGRKISIIGDSVDTFNLTCYKIDGYVMYYPALDVTDVRYTWWMQVIKNSGATLEINASWSGSRVTNTHANPEYPDFYDRVSVIGNPDVIFITLGTNDSTANVPLGEYDYTTNYENLSENEFRPAYIKGVKALRSLYPNAEIVCIAEKMSDDYKESIVNIAYNTGCTFIDASDYVGSSGVHPGILGMRQIASHVLFPTDTTLTQKNIPADASVVGDLIRDTKSTLVDSVIPTTMEYDGYNLLDYTLHPDYLKDHYYSPSLQKITYRQGYMVNGQKIAIHAGYKYVSNGSEIILVNSDGTYISTQSRNGFTADRDCYAYVNFVSYSDSIIHDAYLYGYNFNISYANAPATLQDVEFHKSNTLITDDNYSTIGSWNSSKIVKLAEGVVNRSNLEVCIPKGEKYIVKVLNYSVDGDRIQINEQEIGGLNQTIAKYANYSADDNIYVLTAKCDVRYLRFTEMTGDVTVAVYGYYHPEMVEQRIKQTNENLFDRCTSQYLLESNHVTGYRITENGRTAMSTGEIGYWYVQGAKYVEFNTFRFYGNVGYAFLRNATDDVLLDTFVPTFDRKTVRVEVPPEAMYLGVTYLNEGGFTSSCKVFKLKPTEVSNKYIEEDYGLLKYNTYNNMYTSFIKNCNSVKASSLTYASLKRITASNIQYGHMSQMVIKDGICYGTFLQNSGTDGEQTYSNTSELVLAIFSLERVLSDDFNANTDVTIKRIGKKGDSFAGRTAHSIMKDNAMCLKDDTIYITFSFIENGTALLFSTAYDIDSGEFVSKNVCNIVYDGINTLFTTNALNTIYLKYGYNQTAQGLFEIVSQWSEYNGEYYATGLTMEKANNGFIVKTSDFVNFTLVDVIPFNEHGCAEIISTVFNGKLYVACRQDYGIPYLWFGIYSLSGNYWYKHYKMFDGNVRPWFFTYNNELYFMSTVDEYTRSYTNVYKVITDYFFDGISPLEPIETLYACGTYFATCVYDGHIYFLNTRNTISFGELALINYTPTQIANILMPLLPS